MIRFEETPLEELPIYALEELQVMNMGDIVLDIDEIKRVLKDKQPNLSVLDDYRNKRDIYRQRTDALDEATHNYNELKLEVDLLMKQRLDEFMTGFVAISQKLKEMYQV